MFIKENFIKVLDEISRGNNLGEPITLIGATKTVPVEIINEAITYGLKTVAENKVQEFKQKTDAIKGASQHFIGHLQTNKVKYLVGKVDLIHSIDSIHLAESVDNFASKIGVAQDILVEINVGGELSKSGFTPDNALNAYEQIKKLSAVRVKGFMAMLPKTSDEELKINLCKKMRCIFDSAKAKDDNIVYLSMGMSADYKTAINNGSNMIRLGSTLFGHRN